MHDPTCQQACSCSAALQAGSVGARWVFGALREIIAAVQVGEMASSGDSMPAGQYGNAQEPLEVAHANHAESNEVRLGPCAASSI